MRAPWCSLGGQHVAMAKRSRRGQLNTALFYTSQIGALMEKL